MIVATVWAFFCAVVVGAVIIRWLGGRTASYGQDVPQRFHVGEVSRLGGVALLLGMLAGWAWAAWQAGRGDPSNLFFQGWFWPWLGVLLPAFLGGVAEDMSNRLSVAPRLVMTLLSGLLALWLLELSLPRLGWPLLDVWLQQLPWLGMAIALLAVAGLPHAFNIIDGYNGLAGMVALIVSLALAYVCLQVGDRPLAVVLLCLAGATAGFLVWNYPRGILFAGDGGAYLWGTVIALASLALVQRNPLVSPWFPMLLLSYPVCETGFSMYRKWVRGDSPGMADALHLHQLVYRRLVRQVFHEDEVRRMLKRNNRTSPYLWAFCMLTVLPAVLFWQDTWVLMGCCLAFVLAYIAAYLAIVRFKVPSWMQY